MTPAQVMKRGAQLLAEDATAEFEACQVGDKAWACPDCKKVDGRCPLRAGYDERVKVSASLLVMAEAAR